MQLWANEYFQTIAGGVNFLFVPQWMPLCSITLFYLRSLWWISFTTLILTCGFGRLEYIPMQSISSPFRMVFQQYLISPAFSGNGIKGQTDRVVCCYVNKHSYYVSFVQAEVPGTNSAKKWAVFRGACNFPGARSFLVEGEIIALFGRTSKFMEWSCSFLWVRYLFCSTLLE